MFLTKLKTVTAVLAALAAVGLGLGGLAYTTAASEAGSENDETRPALDAAVWRPLAEQRAIVLLQAAGGRIILDKTQPGEPVVGVYLLADQLNDSHLKLLKEFKSLKTLVLPEGVTDAGWKEVGELKGLARVRSGDIITLSAAKDVAQLQGLRELELGGAEGRGLAELRGLKNLHALTLHKRGSKSAELKELSGLKQLRRLEVSSRGSVDAELTGFSELTNLRELILNMDVGDLGLRDVAKLRSLRLLRVASSRITDAGLAELKPLAGLRQLVLRGTRVTQTGIADLKEARPDLEVTTDADEPILWSDYHRITGKAKVLDATTLLMEDGTRVRLHLRAPKPGERGAKEAAEFLAGLIGDRTVDCFLIEAQLAYVGYVGDVNLEHAMVINGWARGKGGPATIAQEQKRGLWSDNLRDPGR
jgi:endonuclease YncB( thermonuclease family)